MARQKTKVQSEGITRIIVGGFKSIYQEQSIEIKPITILAGANSSGKSSIMQPLLLLKQTLEAAYDPGALLLNGPNAKFTLADQLLSRTLETKSVDTFHVGIQVGEKDSVQTYFEKGKAKGFEVKETIYGFYKHQYRIFANTTLEEARSNLRDFVQAYYGSDDSNISDAFVKVNASIAELNAQFANEIVRDRCFFTLGSNKVPLSVEVIPTAKIVRNYMLRVVHLPGLRGNPERDYATTATGPTFPGTFEFYIASIIEQWQLGNNRQKLAKLFSDLARLALTNKVVSRRKNDVAIELLVNRFLRGNKEDMVSIADVGLGVSQALPVVVALHTANPGQLVYIEQPEIHLHPRAQSVMAEVLADAAKEGKRLVVETHSNLLLRGIQTAVAEGKLPAELVKLHWFTLLEDGTTQISSADLDETGAFGDWPEDFHSVTLNSESRYLDAAEARLMGE